MANREDNDKATEQFRKLFIGGLNISTGEDVLRRHFEQWGELVDVVVMRIGGRNGKSRGFGFVTYKEAEMLDEAQANRPHIIDDRTVETKRAMPREEANSAESHLTVKKLFVGSLKKEVLADDLRDYFGAFGNITECEVITWKETGISRGFGFITFDDYDAVDKILIHKPHFIDDKRCEVKKAISKEESRALKAKESIHESNNKRSEPVQNNSSLMGFMGELRNSLSARYDNMSHQDDRFGRYANQGYSGGPVRESMNYRSQPYSNRNEPDSRRSQPYDSGYQAYSSGSQAYSGGSQAYSGGSQAYSGGSQAYINGNQSYISRNQSNSRMRRDY